MKERKWGRERERRKKEGGKRERKKRKINQFNPNKANQTNQKPYL
jgi:hypothetical protein